MEHRGRAKIQYPRRGKGALRGRGYLRSPSAISAPATPAPPLGKFLASIDHGVLNNVKREEDKLARITNVQYLTSYNWLNKANLEILVPGEPPPEWTPLAESKQLRQDSGRYYCDPNAARYPSYPVEPMIQAILSDRPEFSLRDVDIIGCGSTLGNLLRFARGQSDPFRMLVEVVGNTVFFIRRENSPTDIYAGVRGYGHTFPEANTTWRTSVRESETHQRLITYDFAGLKCLVRFEADGFLPDLVPKESETEKYHTSESGDVKAKEDIASSMQGATVSTVHAATTDAKSQKLTVSKKGEHIPQSAIFDLKTRSIKKSDVDTLGEQLPRLWIRQIPNFILAHHTFGEFKDVRVQDVRENLKRFERDQLLDVVKFGYLLKKIVAFARGAENKTLEIEHQEGHEVLNLREPGGVVRGVLPEALMSQWDVKDVKEEAEEDVQETVKEAVEEAVEETVKEEVKEDVKEEEEEEAGQRAGIWRIFSPIWGIFGSIV